MDRVGAGIVIGVIMHVAAAAEAIARLHIEPDTVALPEHHRGRPDLHVEIDGLTGRQQFLRVMSMVGPIRQAQFLIELAMRCSEPPLPKRACVFAIITTA